MEFSEAYEYSGCPPCVSPDGRKLAVPLGQRLIVRDVSSLRVDYLFTCLDRICQLQWCPQSAQILCRLHGRAILQVWSLSKPDWECKINQGVAGAAFTCWTPDGLHVIVASDFGIRLSVWSLADRGVKHFGRPKSPADCLALSPDGSILAMAERSDCKDLISLTSCATWRTFHRSPTATSDLAGICWSPDSSCLAVWDSPLSYKVVLYGRDGSTKASYSAYEDALGVQLASWGPSGQMLAVASCDQVTRLLHHRTCRPLASLAYTASLNEAQHETVTVYQERNDAARQQQYTQQAQRGQAQKAFGSGFVVQKLPVLLPEIKNGSDAAGISSGAAQLKWSSDGCWLAACSPTTPRVVWIWDMTRMRLDTVVVQVCAVHALEWHPQQAQLVVTTNSPCLYMWCPEGMTTVKLPLTAFRASGLCWAPDGCAVVLRDLDRYVVAFTEPERQALRPEP